jgi:hypothetical protein
MLAWREMPPTIAENMNKTDMSGLNQNGLALITPYAAPKDDWCMLERPSPIIARMGAAW